MEEIWKSVKGYENYYEISNLGNLRSLDRIIIRSDGVARKIYGKKITPVPNSDGYLQAKLCKDGKQTTVKIHRIVALNFVDNPNICQKLIIKILIEVIMYIQILSGLII